MHDEYFGTVTRHMWTATLPLQSNIGKCSIRQLTKIGLLQANGPPVRRAAAVVKLPGGAEHCYIVAKTGTALVGRTHRRPWFAGFLLVVFLAAQLAAAAYACTGSRYQAEHSGTMAAMTESCADMAASDSQQGIDQSGLCLAHCQADAKNADHASPQLPAFMPVLMRVVEPTRVVLAEVRVALRAEAEARGPPPLTILHCSFQT